MTKHKKLTCQRTVTIPKDLSAETGILAGMAIDLSADDNGNIVIRKHIPTCIYCHSTENVNMLRKQEICAKCADKIRKEIEKIYG